MISDRERWLKPALVLFILLFLAACQSEPQATDPPTHEAEPGATATMLSPTVPVSPSNTPEPLVSFKGVEFVFDESVLGSLGSMVHLPPMAPGDAPAQPERLQITLNDGDEGSTPILTIFPTNQYTALSAEAASEITILQQILEERPAEYVGELPLLPMYQAVESYHSNPKYIDFRNGSGISFMVRADHDHSLATEESFFYAFQGLTDDGRYYVAAFVPLTGSMGNDGHESQQGGGQSGGSEHQGKLAANGDWIGIEVGEGHSLIDDIMLSLMVSPDESFPTLQMPDYVNAPDFLLGYDANKSGQASVSYIPSIVEDPESGGQTLLDIPDTMVVTFDGQESAELGAALKVQPLRDEQGAFLTAIPEWQRLNAGVLEDAPFSYGSIPTDGSASDIAEISFQNGGGVRWTARETSNTGDGDSFIYHFHGTSDDGRYLVQFRQPLGSDKAQTEAASYFNDLVGSILVAANASTNSSMPQDPVDCENDAQFVEDVSIPDNTIVDRGEFFVKIWRVRNNGSCTWTPAFKLLYADGNPLDWQQLALTKIVPPGEETEVGVTVNSPEVPAIYETWWQLANEQDQQFGDELRLRFEAPKAATDIPGYGVIEGEINYPANGNPAVDIYFVRTDGSERYVMQTEKGWTAYANTIPVGSYVVFGRVAGDRGDSGGGYTEAVVCGLHSACEDHSLVEVVVEEGRVNRAINLFDWYAPAGTFPFPDSAVQPDGATADDN